MRPDDVRDLLRQKPFRPFRLHVLESTVYEIRHRDFALVTRSTVTIYFPGSNDADPVAERRVIVSLLHITKLEPLPPGM
jgi:hypothetical protein